MFSHEGYTSLSEIQTWIFQDADDFTMSCAAQWGAVHIGDGGFSRELVLFCRNICGLYRIWMLDHCLTVQPVPVFLLSPNGRAVQVSRAIFKANEHLSNKEFNWPLRDPELQLLAEEGEGDEIRRRFNYRVFDGSLCTVAVPFDDIIPQCDPNLHSLLMAAAPFRGWSVCVKTDDVGRLKSSLEEAFDWPRQPSEPEARPQGRPRKVEHANAAYFSIYPDGHRAVGDTWKQAEIKVCAFLKESIGESIRLDTLKRAVDLGNPHERRNTAPTYERGKTRKTPAQ